jgi:hypothetical protein
MHEPCRWFQPIYGKTPAAQRHHAAPTDHHQPRSIVAEDLDDLDRAAAALLAGQRE